MNNTALRRILLPPTVVLLGIVILHSCGVYTLVHPPFVGVQHAAAQETFDKPGDETNSQPDIFDKPTPGSNTRAELERPEETAATPESKIPPALETYMGREIARTMHYSGAPWLIRDEREREERCSLMLANLGIRPQMVICDMGCGVGFHATKMAQMTGEKGYVAGVDVQPQMLAMMRRRMEKEGIENIVPILGSYHNPRLPRETFDMVLMVDVYHEFSHPRQMLASIRASLKPDGVVVLVEYRAEDKTVPIKPEHKMSKAQVEKELTANGFALKRSYDKLPWQHMLFYGRDTDQQNQKRQQNQDQIIPGESTGSIRSE